MTARLPGGAAPRALVFDVQRFSIHDGPGIRTVVFFKGCSLDCAWCQNPEAVEPRPELAYHAERCLPDCDACLPACGEQALRPQRAGRVDFARCTACGDCAIACPAQALTLVGRLVTPADLLEEVRRDQAFYASSGGGLTLSGGEPLLQAGFLAHFLPLTRAAGLHVAVETSGNYPFARLEPLLPLIDLILFDLKLADPRRHARHTGRDNRLVLATLRGLLARGAPLQVRMPVVPGTNTGADDLTAMAELLCDLGLRRLVLLPYNHLWEAKLPRLATSRRPLGLVPPPPAFYADLRRDLRARGIEAVECGV
jgi:pyruvate formate lyase activating enzyme